MNLRPKQNIYQPTFFKLNLKEDIGKRKNPIEVRLREGPLEIGFYSVDADQTFHDNNHQLKTILKPPSGWNAKLRPDLRWNLKKGRNQIIQYSDKGNKHKTHILKWIINHQEKVQRVFMSPNSANIDFVCTRSLLKKICLTLDGIEKWSFNACRFKSVIYMCSDGKSELYEPNPKEKEDIELGPVFEKRMTVRNKDEEKKPVNRNEGYYVILKAQLNEYTLLYSAEVDGKDADIPDQQSQSDLKSTNCYVELKTSKPLEGESRFKLRHWWLQAVLGGIPKIVCGIRGDDKERMIVKELQTFNISKEKKSDNKVKRVKTDAQMKINVDKEIYELCMDEQKKEEYLYICHKVLGFVKEHVEEDHTNSYAVHYTFRLKDRNYVVCKKKSDPEKYREILTEDFTKDYTIKH